MTSRIAILFFFLLILLSHGCRGRAGEGGEEESRHSGDVADLTEVALRWADSVCVSLTLRQKAAQVVMPAVFASNDPWTLRLVRQYSDSCIGGIVLLKGDAEMAAALADSMRTWQTIPPIVSIDAEWGLAMRLRDAPRFPANSSIGVAADEDLMFDYGAELARECRLLGINMVLGPVVDVSTDGGFMSKRSLGSDPIRVADLAVAYARGLESGNVISVAKHFPGHGSVSADSHKRKGIIDKSLHQLDSIDLYPFRKWTEQRLSGIMVGHLAVPAIDSEMRPAAVSRMVISDLLRSDIGFSGLVLTDALNMGGAEGYGAADALAAGADIVVAPANTFEEVESIVRAVAGGKIPESALDSHVTRILFYKYLLSASDAGQRQESTDSRTRDILSALGSPEADSISSQLAR